LPNESEEGQGSKDSWQAGRTALPVHPFPARMAPELALDRLPPTRSVVLDPMMGSGTIPVLAAMRGHQAIGLDLDPLAMLIAEVSASPLPGSRFLEAARAVVISARRGLNGKARFQDEETQEFVDRWFDRVAQRRLAALTRAIQRQPADLRPALWVAFSRLIITKDRGASLARDVSHSRPHRVRDVTDFNPLERFVPSAKETKRRHSALGETRPNRTRVTLTRADAREMPVADQTVDLVMTSPPYLVAIDYLRGHRLSLVWMGHTIQALRSLRGSVVGSHRGLVGACGAEDLVAEVLPASAPPHAWGILRRYLDDLGRILSEIRRVLRAPGRVTLVVGDAMLAGHLIPIPALVDELAEERGFKRFESVERRLPADRRYLPPPESGGKQLGKRMRAEMCLSYRPGPSQQLRSTPPSGEVKTEKNRDTEAR
jgi:hypothetical protein